MNPEVQKQVLAWMASLQTAVEKGAEFVVGQAPGVVQEIVAYGRTVHTTMAVIWLLTLAGLLYVALKSFKKASEDDWDNPAYIVGTAAAGVLSLPILIEGLIPSIQKALLAWVAPRLYVIEWLANILK